jgi:hypothetical protein
MRINTARHFAKTLLALADKAEQEGRTELTKEDLGNFQTQDDVARAELSDAIDQAIANQASK